MIYIEGRFIELSKNKNTIMSRLISSENIVKALSNNDNNFLDQPLIDDPTSLIYSNIYPYKMIPTPEDTAKTFITMSFGYKPDDFNYYKVSNIYFYIITHQSLVKTDLGMLRYDYIINQIDLLFNSQRGLGIGKLLFEEMKDFQINDKWLGAFIGYRNSEFN